MDFNGKLVDCITGPLHNSLLSFRLTYSDLCRQIPESKFRHCLLRTLAVLFELMCSYYRIMSFQLEKKVNFMFSFFG